MSRTSMLFLPETLTRLKGLVAATGARSANQLIESIVLEISDDQAKQLLEAGLSKRNGAKTAEKEIRKRARDTINSLSTEKLKELFGPKEP